MKKFLVGLLTVALAASMLVGCGKKEEKKKADNSLKDVQSDRKSTRLNSSHITRSRMPSSA